MTSEACLVDSHCHLDRLQGADEAGAVDTYLDAARENGVGHCLCVSIDMDNVHDVLAMARHYPDVSASVGLHPNETEGPEPDEERLMELARDPEAVAIGETGLDYFRNEGDDMGWQQARFHRHIAVARELNKPLIIHTRAAAKDTMAILEGDEARDCGGIMHCFAEDWETARRALDIGFHISFSGIVTFKNATDLKEVARKVPMDRMLVETDAPYLAPVPHRGKPNQPAWVRHVGEYLAELRDMEYAALAEQTTTNFRRLFPTTRPTA
ncbi:MAG: TatD family hydrolase [Pseudomonadota bacterium]